MNLLSLLSFVCGVRPVSTTPMDLAVQDLQAARSFVLLSAAISPEAKKQIQAYIDTRSDLPPKGLFAAKELKGQLFDAKKTVMKQWAHQAGHAAQALIHHANLSALTIEELKAQQDLPLLWRWDIPIFYHPAELYLLLLCRAGYLSKEALYKGFDLSRLWQPRDPVQMEAAAGDLFFIQSYWYIRMSTAGAREDLVLSIEGLPTVPPKDYGLRATHILPLWSAVCFYAASLVSSLAVRLQEWRDQTIVIPSLDRDTGQDALGLTEMNAYEPFLQTKPNLIGWIIKEEKDRRRFPSWLKQDESLETIFTEKKWRWMFMSSIEAICAILIRIKLISRGTALRFLTRERGSIFYPFCLDWKQATRLADAKASTDLCRPGDLIGVFNKSLSGLGVGLVWGAASVFRMSLNDTLICPIDKFFADADGTTTWRLSSWQVRTQMETFSV